MAVTILEALQNARHNLNSGLASHPLIIGLAKEQLNNAVTLLERGYDLHEEVEPLVEQYGDVESVPDKTT